MTYEEAEALVQRFWDRGSVLADRVEAIAAQLGLPPPTENDDFRTRTDAIRNSIELRRPELTTFIDRLRGMLAEPVRLLSDVIENFSTIMPGDPPTIRLIDQGRVRAPFVIHPEDRTVVPTRSRSQTVTVAEIQMAIHAINANIRILDDVQSALQ